MEHAILETVGLSLKYGDYAAVSSVDLRIRPNKLHSIIGPNGAGKTSLFHLLSGTREATSGKVVFRGEEITRLQPHQRLHKGIARSFQITELFWGASVLENVRLAVQARQRRESRAMLRAVAAFSTFNDEARELLEKLGLSHLASVDVAQLSHGQQRLVEIAVCLAGSPSLILLDEPTSGMGIDDIPRMMELVRSLTRDYTVVLIEHNMGIVMKLSDEITVLAHGEVLAQGTPAEVSANPAVRGAYLSGPEMLRLQNVRAGYGKSEILHGVSLTVDSGCVCLLGRNGAGKTTLLRTAVGLTKVFNGRVMLGEENITSQATFGIARRGLSLVPENRGIFAKLTVHENLDIAVRAGSRWAISDVYAMFPRLRERERNGGHQLSGGEQQMLAIARALVSGPKVLLLDEPTEGLSPIMVQEIVRVLHKVKAAGLPILLVEQSLATCFQVADRACILEDGQLVYDGTVDELRSRIDVQERYLSVAA